MDNFIFPQEPEKYQIVKSIVDLKQIMKQEARELKMASIYFVVLVQKNKYLYATCSKCHIKIKYRKHQQQEYFKLIKFQNRHQHKVCSYNRYLENIIKELPLNMTIKSKKMFLKSKFCISDSKFYYLNKKINNNNSTFKDFIEGLDAKKYQNHYDPFPLESDQLPNAFLSISPEMKQLFHRFGQFMAVDLTYNIIKQTKIARSFQGEQQIKKLNYGIIVICGLNNHNHIVPFAIGMMNSQKKQDFISIFRSFFSIMQTQPEIIISDEQNSIQSSIQYLRQNNQFSGFQALDSFHIIKNLKKRCRNQNLLSSLKKMMLTPSKQQFDQILSKINRFTNTESQNKLVKDFLLKANKHCLSQIPNKFCGIHLSSSFLQKTNDLIKTRLPYQQSAKNAMNQIFKLMEELIQKSRQWKLCSIKYQTTFQSAMLKQIRYTLCEPIFNFFLKNYIKSLSVYFQQQHLNQWIIYSSLDQKSKFHVEIKQNKLQCNCYMIQKHGLPCEHIIAIGMSIRQNMINYIHKRWYVDFNEEMATNSMIIINKGRPKNSRKNLF